jgi:hypothetical protein
MHSRKSPYNKSPSPSTIANYIPKKSLNISDTSLFSEIVKGQKIPEKQKMVKDIILLSENSKPSSANNNDNNPDKSFSTNGDLKDIPVPTYSNGVSTSSIGGESTNVIFPPAPNQPPLPREPHPYGRKSKTTDLPMPPGIDVPPDVKTPSPPRDNHAGPSKKTRLLDMPMPPMVSDYGNDENDAYARRTNRSINRGNGTARPHRPKIVNRRRSESFSGDWGERCVEVFQIIAQIGEGKLL